jgi:hypothetical protein
MNKNKRRALGIAGLGAGFAGMGVTAWIGCALLIVAANLALLAAGIYVGVIVLRHLGVAI